MFLFTDVTPSLGTFYRPNREHQEQRLETTDWQHLADVAAQAVQDATQSPNTIISVRSDVTNTAEGSSLPGYTRTGSSATRQQGGENYVDDEEKGGFGSFVSSLKAMMSSVLPKPDPLVCALCEAAARGDTRLVQGLIDQGANIDGKNENRDTPMHVAIQANQIEVASLLMDAGVDLEAANSSSKLPPLFQAAAAGQIGMAKMFLEHGCDPNQKLTYGTTPYFYEVVERGTVDGVRLLLEHGADVEETNATHSRPLAAAVKRGSVPMVELLLSHNAKVNGSVDYGSGTILGLATATKDVELVRLLLDAGADADAKTSSGAYVLVEAVVDRQLELAHLLLRHGARGDRKTLAGQPLLIAVIRDKQMAPADKTDLVRRLLQRGAKATAKDNGLPALRYALEPPPSLPPGSGGGGGGGGGGLPDVVALLLQHGAEANKCVMNSATGESALLYTIRTGKTVEMGLLLKHGANVNDAGGGSGSGEKSGAAAVPPLVQAVVRRDADMIRVLRSYGARLDDTMLEFAKAMVQQPEIYETVTADLGPVGRPLRGGRGGGAGGRFEVSISMGSNQSLPAARRASSPPPAYETVTTPTGK